MKKYYHATSFENALKIEKEGFRLGKDGMFGGGIYFSEKPIGATKKARVSKCDALIVVYLETGRLLTEELAHNNWNLQILNSLGYDSVQMTHCRTGVEICVYEPSRVKIIGIINWDQYNISFRNITTNNCDQFDLNDYIELINGRRVNYDQCSSQNLISFQKLSPEQVKQNALRQLDDIGDSMTQREKMTIAQHSSWSNYEKPRLSILKEYLDFQDQLRQQYYDLKPKLDQRINSFISLLRSEEAQTKREMEFVNSLCRGIGTMSSLSTAPQMIRELEKYKKERDIY